MTLQDKIKAIAEAYHKDTIKIRRHLHKNPELSYQETKTGHFIAAELDRLGISYQHGVADNGVVALIKGKNSDKNIVALRADIDALPILEENNVSYKSKNEGVMHACGHDVHTASLLGVAHILQEVREEFEGSVKLIFQPAEEKLPGGASLMIKEGVLENPTPKSILGQHVHPPLEVGKVGFRGGMYMASADEIYLTVKGKGGHGALPHNGVDTILMAAQIVSALQQVVSRNGNPTVPSVLTLGKINSVGGATNIIPDEVKIEGTFRTMDEQWRSKAHERITTIAENIALSMGGSCEVNIMKGYPFLMNDESLTARCKDAAIDFLGAKNVVDLPIRMTAEDFSYYSQEMPACFYRLGTGNPSKGITSPVHTPTFDIDENSLKTSIGLMAWLALVELKAVE